MSPQNEAVLRELHQYKAAIESLEAAKSLVALSPKWEACFNTYVIWYIYIHSLYIIYTHTHTYPQYMTFVEWETWWQSVGIRGSRIVREIQYGWWLFSIHRKAAREIYSRCSGEDRHRKKFNQLPSLPLMAKCQPIRISPITVIQVINPVRQGLDSSQADIATASVTQMSKIWATYIHWWILLPL